MKNLGVEVTEGCKILGGQMIEGRPMGAGRGMCVYLRYVLIFWPGAPSDCLKVCSFPKQKAS